MPPSPPDEIDILAVAFLAAAGRTQMEIHRILGLSQSAVSRHYNRLKDDYIRTTFCQEKISPEVMQKILLRTSRRDVEKKLKALAQEHGLEGPTVHSVFIREGADMAEQFTLFAAGASPVVYDLMKLVRRTVGVAWGSTLWQTTDLFRSVVGAPWRSSDPIDFIPLCGEPLVDTVHARQYADRTSSNIASELSKIVNGDNGPRPAWLGLVPAFIPRTFLPRDRKVIDRLIDLVPNYGSIFGPRLPTQRPGRPRAEDLDMIFTAAGDADHPVGFGKGPLLQLEADEAKALGDHIFGDIGGVLIPKPERSSKRPSAGKKLVDELTGLWTGLKMDHLKLCARQAFAEHSDKGGRPGVTLLGFREELAPLVCQAVRLGLVNHLIIGSPLESAIEKALTPKTQSQHADVGQNQSGAIPTRPAVED